MSSTSNVTQGSTVAAGEALIDDSTASARFSAGVGGSGLTATEAANPVVLRLIRPDGSVVTPDTPATTPSIVYSKDDTIQAYTVAVPEAGAWRLLIDGVQCPSGGVRVDSSVYVQSNLLFTFALSDPSPVTGRPVLLRGELRSMGQPITGATVVVETQAPTALANPAPAGDESPSKGAEETIVMAPSETVVLFDDGAHDDGAVGDGVYAGWFSGAARVGSYKFTANAAGVSQSGTAFRRQATLDAYFSQSTNRPPVAVAGIDQVLECTGYAHATAVLDGSSSSDRDSTPGTNDDITSYIWQEGAQTLAAIPIASVPFSLGVHDVMLTVTDKGGLSGSDDVSITVRDTQPPFGTITAPNEGQCFGSAGIPVVVQDNDADVCDPNIVRAYDPSNGPSYAQHNDYHVTLTATDSSGNSSRATRFFTIDLVAPKVAFVILPNQWSFPKFIPFSQLFSDADDDGATGSVVHETVKVDGCLVYDGLTYGNGDGLLLDEKLPATEDEMCRLVRLCSKRDWRDPVIAVTATDCGGNSSTARMVVPGGYHVAPSRCP